MTKQPDLPQFTTAEALAERVRSAAAGYNPVFLLDYDGTLTPIVENPDDAILSAETRQILSELSARYPVAIISGRERRDVQKRIGLDSLYYAGSHGLDIAGPADDPLEFVKGAEFIPVIQQAIAALESGLTAVPGVLVESKTYSVAVHTRQAAEADIPAVEDVIARILAEQPRLRTKSGKHVVELIPDIDWHKGRAATWLIEKLQPAHGSMFPVFLGDDLTDEDVFAALPDSGIGALIAREPRPSRATVRLAAPTDVVAFLKIIAAA